MISEKCVYNLKYVILIWLLQIWAETRRLSFLVATYDDLCRTNSANIRRYSIR